MLLGSADRCTFTGVDVAWEVRLEVYVASAGEQVEFVPPGAYGIVIRFGSGLSDAHKRAFAAAADRWTTVIRDDLPAVTVDGELIDDLLIIAGGAKMDGPGRVLGRAGPTHLRPAAAGSAAFLPARGEMLFDTADLDRMAVAGTLGDVIAHEMGHVIGIGTVWERKGLLLGRDSPDPTFVGAAAVREYAMLNGAVATSVPVEAGGGPGTANSHWRESVFRAELMSGYVSAPGNPLSRMTAASLSDIGYGVDLAAAEPYAMPRIEAKLESLGTPIHVHDEGVATTSPIVLPASSIV